MKFTINIIILNFIFISNVLGEVERILIWEKSTDERFIVPLRTEDTHDPNKTYEEQNKIAVMNFSRLIKTYNKDNPKGKAGFLNDYNNEPIYVLKDFKNENKKSKESFYEPPSTKPKILIMRNSQSSFVGNYAIESKKHETTQYTLLHDIYRTLLNNEEDFISFSKELAQIFDGLIGLGGPGSDFGITGRKFDVESRKSDPWYFHNDRDMQEIIMIQNWLKFGNSPYYGICRGMQIGAISLGAEINQHVPGSNQKIANDYVISGQFKIEFDKENKNYDLKTDRIFKNIYNDPNLNYAYFSHGRSIQHDDQIKRFGDVIAFHHNKDIPVIVKLKEDRGYLFQFHPETEAPISKEILKNMYAHFKEIRNKKNDKQFKTKNEKSSIYSKLKDIKVIKKEHSNKHFKHLNLTNIHQSCDDIFNYINENSKTQIIMDKINECASHLNLERQDALEIKDENGRTPLILAAKNGNIDLVKKLLDEGANVNARDFNQSTALNEAIFARKNNMDDNKLYEVIKILLARPNINLNATLSRIDPNDENKRIPKHEYSPLRFALENIDDEVFELLLNKGANRNLSYHGENLYENVKSAINRTPPWQANFDPKKLKKIQTLLENEDIKETFITKLSNSCRINISNNIATWSKNYFQVIDRLKEINNYINIQPKNQQNASIPFNSIYCMNVKNKKMIRIKHGDIWGRSTSNDGFINKKDAKISRIHLKFFLDDNGIYSFKDLSHNGTKILNDDLSIKENITYNKDHVKIDGEKILKIGSEIILCNKIKEGQTPESLQNELKKKSQSIKKI